MSRHDDRKTHLCEAAPSAGDLVLTVLSGSEAGRRITLPEAALQVSPVLLGRGGRSAVLLTDPDDPPLLSREHLCFAVAGDMGQLALVTDQSKNGTWLNGTRLETGRPHGLRSGDRLDLGVRVSLQVDPAGRVPVPNSGAGAGAGSEAAFADRRATWPADGGPRQDRRSMREQLADPSLLDEAWRRVALNRGGAGVDAVTVAEFAADAPRQLAGLREELRRDRYQPLPPRRVAVPKRDGGARVLCILAVRDRIVQHALHRVLAPQIEPRLAPCSFAYRPGRSALDAARQVDRLLVDRDWVAETDVAEFFDRVDHAILLDQVARVLPDAYLLGLLARCLGAGAAAAGRGIPQGGAASPLLANFYLSPFDFHLLDAGLSPVLYGDDLVIPCAGRGEAQRALARAEAFLREHLALSLRPDKTRVTHREAGFTFLGFAFRGRERSPGVPARDRLARLRHEAAPDQEEAAVAGWSRYYGPASAPASASTNGGGIPEADASLVALLQERFPIRRSEFARLTAVAGKRRFVPCAGCLPSAGIREHLRGGESVAGYLLLESGGTRLLAMDLDPAETPRGSAVPLPSAVADLCRRLRDTCRAAGVPHLAVDSGGGGRHLWVRFSREVSPEDARRLGRLLAYRAGWPEAGARLEVFPRHTEWPGASLGEALPLPGGLHPVTGQPRTALDEQDRPLRLEDALRQFGEVEAESVPRLLEALAGGPPPADAGGAGIRPRRRKTTRARETAGPVEALRQGCTVIRAIEERASGTGHLRHVHNLILLYTAGRLGSEGAAYLHRVIGSTRNYRPEVCQSYIDQLDPDRQPITCARIREWLDEEGESHLCRCPRNRRTPLTVLNNTPSAPRLSTEDEPEAGLRGRPRAPAVMAKPPAAEQWTDVYSDRFDAGESPAELPVADSPGSTSEPETGDGDD